VATSATPPEPARRALETARTAVQAEDVAALRAAVDALEASCAELIAATAATIAGCARCRALPPTAYAFYCGDTSEPLPVAAYEIIGEDARSSGSRVHVTVACPTCGTRYRYDTDYEYLVGGTEDEEHLTRLAVGELIGAVRQQLAHAPRWWALADAVDRLAMALA